MNYNIVLQLADHLSNSPLEDERISALRPIENLIDYYKQPLLGFSDPQNQKEYVVKWKDEKDRIKQLKKINKLIREYNIEVKQNKKEFNKLIPPDGKVYSASELGFQKPTIPIKEHPLWAFRCILTLARDEESKMRLLKSNSNIYIDDEKLYNLYLEMDKKDFVELLNKEIFSHIQVEVLKSKDLDAWDSDNMWYEPNKRFVKWFQLNDINLKADKNESPTMSKWSKEVVILLKESIEMKNTDIILALYEKGMPPSYRHLSQIFKSKSDRKFYEEELINNGSYFSLKTSK